jgi:hypothetical protein
MKQWMTPNVKYIHQTQLLLCTPSAILGCSALQTIKGRLIVGYKVRKMFEMKWLKSI